MEETYTYKNESFFDEQNNLTNIQLSQPHVRKPSDDSIGYICYYPTLCRYVYVTNHTVYPVKNYARL